LRQTGKVIRRQQAQVRQATAKSSD
jgi:hypothetical protein